MTVPFLITTGERTSGMAHGSWSLAVRGPSQGAQHQGVGSEEGGRQAEVGSSPSTGSWFMPGG